MKPEYASGLFAGLMVGLGWAAQAWPQLLPGVQETQLHAAPASAAAGPRIQFATNLLDFGKVPVGQTVKCEYVFTNTGDQMLEILSVHPGCACSTAGNWTKQVAPGRMGKIPIQFNTANYNGPVVKYATVTCNVSNQPVVMLEMRGTIWKPIEVTPPYVYFSLSAECQSNETRSVRIVSNPDIPVTLAPPVSSHPAFAAELKTVRPGKEFELVVRTVPPLNPGMVQGEVSLKTSLTNLPAISVSVLAMVQQAIMAMPSQLMLPAGPLPAAMRMGVTVRNSSLTNVILTEPAFSRPDVTVQLQEIQPGRVWNLLLGFPGGFELAPGERAELSVKTSHPLYPRVAVPVIQAARPAAIPAAAPTPTAATNPLPVVAPPSMVAPASNPMTNAARLFPLRRPPPLPPLPPPLPPAPSAR
jgi:hypothetical protein